MKPTTTSLAAFAALPLFLARFGLADDPTPFTMCTGQDCDDCPSSVTSDGLGYPSCAIYDRDDVIGGNADKYTTVSGGKKEIYFDIPDTGDRTKQTIIRSPADVDDVNCGFPLYKGRGGVCQKLEIDNTFMVEFCEGTEECDNIGSPTGRKHRLRRGEKVTRSMLLKKSDGSYHVPKAVGQHGVDHSLEVRALIDSKMEMQKRDGDGCDGYTPDGGLFTTTGDESYVVSGQICGNDTSTTIENSHSVSRSETFGLSVSDPFGIISASIMTTFEESESQSYSYMFTPNEASCGRVMWTPILECTKGSITGCDGGDKSGRACRGKRISDQQLDGVYHFTVTDG